MSIAAVQLAMFANAREPAEIVPALAPVRVQRGDLWQLGRHRLLCGDATDTDDVTRLMSDARAHLCLTDPPYNVGMSYRTHNDRLEASAYERLSRDWWALAMRHSRCVMLTPGMVNVALWYSGRVSEPPRWMAAWYKANQCSRSALGGFNVWEPVLVWGKPARKVGHDAWSMPIRQQLHTRKHPCPKLLEFWQSVLEAGTLPAHLVYDPFLGSGTTVIAAERSKRRCYGLEIDSHYCDIILRRWEQATGQHAVLLERQEARAK